MKLPNLSIYCIVLVAGLTLSVSGIALAQTFEPQYEGGYPTAETAEAMFEEYDYQAAVQFYVWAYPYLNTLGHEKGFARMGGDERSIYTFDKRMQPQHILMTANAEVIYNWTRFMDLSKGPIVVEIPPRVRGHFYDMGVHAYVDVGDVGPDKGKGGKYLLVAADYDGVIPSGYFEVRSRYSDRLAFIYRAFPESEGSDEAAVELSKQARWYYLSEADNPPDNGRVMIGNRPYSQDWPRDEEAFAWLAEAFNLDSRIPETGLAHMGNMRRLGLVPGEPFAPDERAQAILKRAAKTAEAVVLSMAFRNRAGAIYDNRQFDKTSMNKSPVFLIDNYEEVEERAGGWHQLIGNFASYFPAKPGTGQFLVSAYRDKDGNPLIGSNTYRWHVPAEVPVKQFWQIPVYNVATRAMIDNEQRRSAITGTDDLKRNNDGSVDLYFGPEAPDGYEQNWIQTNPQEGWFSLPRLYAPLEPIISKEWRWNDIELVKKGDIPLSTGAIPEYIGGYPTKETAKAMFKEYDYQAATQFYVWAYAYLNSMGMEKGLAKMGGDERSIYVFDKRIQAQHILMTANKGVIYNWTRYIDLSKGPVVFEVPPRVRGHFYDMGMRAYVDVGDIGPDGGKGGKYLVVPHDYAEEIPEGYFEVRIKYSNRFTLGFRSFPGSEGSDEAAVALAGQAKWYYLSEADTPPENSRVFIGDRAFSQDWPRDEEAFVWFGQIFNMDSYVPMSGRAHMGNMRRLGLVQDQPFSPDTRAQAVLKRAAKTAEAMVLSMAFSDRQDAEMYGNRQYRNIFTNKSPLFYQDNYEEVEQRAGGWHQLVGNFSQYIPTKPGTGGLYMNSYTDRDGNYLIGSNTYRLRVPAEVPVKQFWEIPVYEAATRSYIDTDQGRSALSGTDNLKRNADGSVDLYFGPKAPKGFEKNWIKTKPGEGWFTLPRLYAPLEPILDKTWRWNDIEKIN